MPPKKPPAPSKKADMKKKEKIIEDKTFGLKNKKGSKQQKFIQQVEKQVKQGNQPQRKIDAAATKKDDKKNVLDEFNMIFKPVQKIEKGADPKSVLCAFFKQGQCTKGDKCKFSHDLAVERKAEKRNIYEDTRDQDTMDTWDDDKLKEVVEKKHGEKEKAMPKTDIICRHFIDALETNKYGWFWECPNGGDKCHYRHALPPGFVLKRDAKKEKAEQISIEDLVERERAQLSGKLTPVTFETFLAWKKRKLEDRKSEAKEANAKKKAEFQAGRAVGLSGRDMFTFRPELANEGENDDDEGDTFDMRQREDNEHEDVCRELNLEDLANLAGTGDDTLRANGVDRSTGASAAQDDGVPIDEDLFADELEGLDEELENLDLKDDSS